MELFKDFLAKTGNLKLFTTEQDDSLGGLITLQDKAGSSVYVYFVLDDKSCFNEINVLINRVDLSKKYKALDLVNEFNVDYMAVGSTFSIYEAPDGNVAIMKKCIYTSIVEDFNPYIFNKIFLDVLEDIERNDIEKVMHLVWE